MTDIDPKFKELIMDTTADVLRDTGLDKVPFEDLTVEQVEMLCDRMSFEIKAKLTKHFAGLGAPGLKEHFDIVDESVKEVKRRYERERKGE